VLQRQSDAPLIGVKIYEYSGDLPRLFDEWERLGVNTAFVGAALATNRAFMDHARSRGIGTFIIVPVFFNPEALEKDPGLFAVTADGRKAEKDWVQFICPSRDDYLEERLRYIKKLLVECAPDGLSIDFIRYFTFWETVRPEVGPDPLANTCFCPICMKRFQDFAGISPPAHLAAPRERAEWVVRNCLPRWADWKCRTITEIVRRIAHGARQSKPGLLVSLHLTPWRTNDFRQAIRSVAGQDAAALGPLVDYLSPMCYAHMVRRPSRWIGSVVDDLARRVSTPILPSIQVAEAYRREKVSAALFRDYLEEALKPPSRGVVFWNWDSLEKDADKRRIVRAMCGKQGSAQTARTH
jgi:GNAT superfamily N-acetyltransferase